jgi:hypothetical protein
MTKLTNDTIRHNPYSRLMKNDQDEDAKLLHVLSQCAQPQRPAVNEFFEVPQVTRIPVSYVSLLPMFSWNSLHEQKEPITRSSFTEVKNTAPAKWSHVRYRIERSMGHFHYMKGRSLAGYYLSARLAVDLYEQDPKKFPELGEEDEVHEQAVLLISRHVCDSNLPPYVPEELLEEHKKWLSNEKTGEKRSRKQSQRRRGPEVKSFCCSGKLFQHKYDTEQHNNAAYRVKKGDFGHPSLYRKTPPAWYLCRTCRRQGQHYDNDCVFHLNEDNDGLVDENGSVIFRPGKLLPITGIPQSQLLEVENVQASKGATCFYDRHGRYFVRKEDALQKNSEGASMEFIVTSRKRMRDELVQQILDEKTRLKTLC